jgi:ketosteroid isomerase-like protein
LTSAGHKRIKHSEDIKKVKDDQQILSTQKLLDIISKKNPDLENKKTAEVQWVRLNDAKAKKRSLMYLFIGLFTGILATGGIFYLWGPASPPRVELNSLPENKSMKPAANNKVETASSDSKEGRNQPIDTEKIIQDNISRWKTAWEQKDITAYKAFYSPAFRSGKFDRRTWLDNKEKTFGKPGDILIAIHDVKISVKGRRAFATFVQHHKSPALTDKGVKTVTWVNEANVWKIICEDWKPLKK